MSSSKRILVIGVGFGGVWSSLSAMRAIGNAKRTDIEVAVIAPEPVMYMRPRLYESDLSQVAPSVREVFATAGVRFIHGIVTRILTMAHVVEYTDNGASYTIDYARLVLATGSEVWKPASVQGLHAHGFFVDSFAEAQTLQMHLQSLPAGRNTVVVAGGGFTGIETATELAGRLRPHADIIIVEKANEVGPDLGAGPRPAILQALKELRVTVRSGETVVSVDADGVTLASGARIEAKTVIWTVGVRASSLTQQITGAERDAFGRLVVDNNLKVLGAVDVFATGDAAHARTDDEGHVAMMSCQHAMWLGRSSGNNAAQDLLGLPQHVYHQSYYGTCLDLGSFGAVITEGWDRKVLKAGPDAKEYKKNINEMLIYPPSPDVDRAELMRISNPDMEYEWVDGLLVLKFKEAVLL